MANYPGALSSLAINKANNTASINDHFAHHNAIADEVNAIEAELGVSPSASYATVKARLDAAYFDVRAYGAVGDGTTDDTAAINTAIAAINTAGRGVLFFPSGIFKVTSALTTLTSRYVTVLGAGWGTSRIDHAFNGNLFTFNSAGAGSTDIGVSDLWVLRTSATVTSGAVFASGQIGNGTFERLYLQNAYTCFQFGASLSDPINVVYIEDVVAGINNGGNGIIWDGTGGGLYATKFACTGGAAHTGGNGLLIRGYIDVFVLDRAYFEQTYNGVTLAPAGATAGVVDWWITDCILDDGNGTALLIQPSSSAQVIRGVVSGTWFANKLYNLLFQELTGGTIKDIRFMDGNHFLGYKSEIQSGTEIYFDGCDFYDSIASGSLLTFYGSLTRFGVKNCRIGSKYGAVAAASIGINIGASCTDFEIAENDLSKNTTPLNIPDSSLVSTARVENNRGFNALGSVVPPAVPASNVFIMNSRPAAVTVVISGGTLTQVQFKGTNGGTFLAGTVAGTYRLPRGAQIAIVYTVAPTWTWFME